MAKRQEADEFRERMMAKDFSQVCVCVWGGGWEDGKEDGKAVGGKRDGSNMDHSWVGTNSKGNRDKGLKIIIGQMASLANLPSPCRLPR